jgi:hypothetical protein
MRQFGDVTLVGAVGDAGGEAIVVMTLPAGTYLGPECVADDDVLDAVREGLKVARERTKPESNRTQMRRVERQKAERQERDEWTGPEQRARMEDDEVRAERLDREAEERRAAFERRGEQMEGATDDE